MVSITRTYSIREDLVEKLKEEGNASKLICDLLDNYFNKENSIDIQELTKQLREMDDDLDDKRLKRDRVADRIRELDRERSQTEDEVKKREAQKEYKKGLGKWLSEKVRSKEISFDEYMIIKSYDNWDKLVERLIDGEIKLDDLLKEISFENEDENSEN